MPTKLALLSDTLDADDSTTAVDLGASGHRCICCEAVVSVVEGTDPTLDLVLETSADGVTWAELCAFEQVTATGTVRILPDRTERYVRLSWDIGGTDSPAFTVKVIGYSFDSYCSPSEFAALGLPDGAIESVKNFVIASNLEEASGFCNGYLEEFYTLPLLAWSPSLKGSAAKIAAFNIMCVKGFNTTAGENSYFRKRYEDAIVWLEGVANAGDPGTTGSDDTSEDTSNNSSFAVASCDRRGW